MKVLLCCSGGFSSGLVASRVQKAAQARNLDVSVEFNFPPFMDRREEALEEFVRGFDVLLIAPQIRFMLPPFRQKLAEIGIPYDVIDSVAYGRCDGDKVLDQALALVQSRT